MGALGSLLRAIVLALVFGAVVAIVGALAALFGCAEACRWAEPASEIVSAPAPGLEDIPFALLVGGLLVVGLAISFIPRDPVMFLAAIFSALIGVDSFLYWLPRTGAEEIEPPVTPAEETVPTEPEAEPETLVQPETLSCPLGSFAENGACVPCETEEVIIDAPQVTFEEVDTGASWKYARDNQVVTTNGGATLSLDDFAEDLALRTEVCDASSLLVYGSASSDGARALNVARAQSRADNLADALKDACTGRSDGLTIFVLSLGQSEAPVDVAEDRLVGISIMNSPLGDDLDGPVILDELGYAIAEGARVAPLLDRRSRFPNPWQGPSGTVQGIEVKDRPSRVLTVAAPGAPASCEAPEVEPTALDGAPFLRQ